MSPPVRLATAALAGVVLASLASSPSRTSSAVAQESRPNVLIILTDDQRDTGTMQMLPRIRRLFGERGTRYTEAYATTPNCCPSRTSIFTGRYTHNHNVKGNVEGSAPQLDQGSTVQRYLRDAGYSTAIYGKYLNNWNLSENPPHFDDWAIFSRPNNYYGTTFNVSGTVSSVPRYSTDFITSRALRFLRLAETDDARPWFLYLAPYAPHLPAVAEPAYRRLRVRPLRISPAREEFDRFDKPGFVQIRRATLRNASSIRTRQLRSLRSVDDMAAAVFRMMSQLGEQNTLAFFLSDNGFLWAEHGLIGKNLPYTESVKIPLYVRWPQRVPGGITSSRIVANVDLAPTILDAMGIRPDPEFPMDGRSLFSPIERERILLEYWPEAIGHPPVWASIRTRTYQYTEYYAVDEVTPVFVEFYDLMTDPWQLYNLLGDYDPANDPFTPYLSARLAQDRACFGDACP